MMLMASFDSASCGRCDIPDSLDSTIAPLVFL
jgi:hypothetical protein